MRTGLSEVTYCRIKGIVSCISWPHVNRSDQEVMFVKAGGCRVKQVMIWQVKTGYPVSPEHTNRPIASALQLCFCEL
jgi:hypothetical protein